MISKSASARKYRSGYLVYFINGCPQMNTYCTPMNIHTKKTKHYTDLQFIIKMAKKMHGIFNEAINMKLKKLSTTIGLLTVVTSLMAQQNPVFPGNYADPEGIVYNNTYWVFPTYSAPYGEQLF